MVGKRKRPGGRDGDEHQGIHLAKRTTREVDLNGDPKVSSETKPLWDTPTKPRRGRPPGSGQKSKILSSDIGSAADVSNSPTPKRKSLFSTPVKESDKSFGESGISVVRTADRSARRKSARTLIEPTSAGGLSEEEDLEDDDLIARQIWDANEGESAEEEDGAEGVESAKPNTPSKGKRGRRKKSPTPPVDLPPHEQYFWQNRPGKLKTSSNTLSSLSLLTHEQYHKQISAYKDPHQSSCDDLHAIHSRGFPQWNFELSQSFNICLHGYGSKRKLVAAFAGYLHSLSSNSPPKILMVNGHNPTLTLRGFFISLAVLVFNYTPATLPSALGTQPREILSKILEYLAEESLPTATRYHIFINSLDTSPLCRSNAPSLLAQLADCPRIHLLVTCDTPNFPLLWSTALRDQYQFVFHDTTTYLSYAEAEVSSAVNSVNELLGRSGRSVKGKEGVGFVLRSLPENARSLYRVLIAELLVAMDEEGGQVGVEGGMEYKALYQKVVEEFICSNEMGFRQLLKEFYDHQMVVSKRDGTGAELLGVPFRREEMEAILEDLVD
ncbi:Origin recognition complex subunit 2 [Lecanora helva]